jgi:hypothetical protein
VGASTCSVSQALQLDFSAAPEVYGAGEARLTG